MQAKEYYIVIRPLWDTTTKGQIHSVYFDYKKAINCLQYLNKFDYVKTKCNSWVIEKEDY